MSSEIKLWTDVDLITLGANGEPYGLIEAGAITVEDGRITWLGKQCDIPQLDYAETFACDGRVMTPGLIDCHTHLVYGGDRVREFEMRLQGMDYAEIARRGGGILSTVRQTREADAAELMRSAGRRLQYFIREGVTTIEIKSGYGLDTDNELKLLNTIHALNKKLPISLVATFLGAHAIPAEFTGKADAYIELVCNEMLPLVAEHRLASAVDAFCESIAFTPEQTSRVFAAAQSHDLAIKLHADQLSDSGGAALAAGFGALSADHLEYTTDAGVQAMAANNTTAVLLPGAFYTLGETRLPAIELFRKHGVPMAIASDSNPGSAPILSLQLILNMACTLFKLTPEEALRGVTSAAARALGIDNEVGTLAVGKKADFALWNINHPAELACYAGGNRCFASFKEGRKIVGSVHD